MMKEQLDGWRTPNNLLVTTETGDKEEFEILTEYIRKDPRNKDKTYSLKDF